MSKRMSGEIRREQIAEAGLTLAAQGVEAVTVEKVAAMIGVVPSALYRHFKNKGEILDAMLDLVGRRVRENVQASVQEAPGDTLLALKALMLRHVGLLVSLPAMPKLLFSDEIYQHLPDKRAKLFSHIMAFRQAVAGLVSQGQEAGAIRSDVDPMDLTMFFLGLMAPAAIFFHLSGGNFDIQAQAERNWPLFEETARPNPARQGSAA